MSTDDAAWLYNITKRGDVVDVTGTDRPMTLTNGYGDWNESFREYKRARRSPERGVVVACGAPAWSALALGGDSGRHHGKDPRRR